MWLQRLAVTAFGPLVDQELELAPGLNVIHGANESAKSTWHAALTVGLCGRRRGAGRRAEDAAFEARHRPWDGDERWGTTLRLQLLDERVIEIRRDLVQGRAQVVDVGLGGRPIADDLIVDGTPDGSAWLGLDRSSFPATASVRQAQLLEVAAHADALREHLARAATGGAGVTAAAALQRLIAFQRERVGVDKANAVKPLRRAIDARAHARHRLDEVQSAHRNFLVLLGEAEEGRREVAAARQQVASIEAALAVEAADAAAPPLTGEDTSLDRCKR